jgi:hypothetical protein
LHPEFRAYRASIFPGKLVVQAMFNMIPETSGCQIPEVGSSLDSLPLLRQYKQEHLKKCLKCFGDQSNEECSFDEFLNHMFFCTTLIILLSMIDAPSGTGYAPKLLYRGSILDTLTCNKQFMTLSAAVGEMMQNKTVRSPFTLATLIGSFEELLAHEPLHQKDDNSIERFRMGSAFQGQVLFLQVSNTYGQQEQESGVRINCCAGTIWYQEQSYKELLCLASSYRRSVQIVDEQINKEVLNVLTPANKYGTYKPYYKVEVLATSLKLEIVLNNPTIIMPIEMIRSPACVIQSILNSIFIDCNHDCNKAYYHAEGMHLESAFHPTLSDLSPKHTRGVVQTEGHNEMRVFALASGVGAVIRRQACLGCCIACAQATGMRYVIC